MNTKGIIAVILLVISIGFGIWTGVSGKPYNTGLFTVHKLSGLGFGVLIIIIAVNGIRSGSFSGQDIALTVVFGISVIALIATGAIMSGDKPISALRIIHIVSAVISIVTGFVQLAFLVR